MAMANKAIQTNKANNNTNKLTIRQKSYRYAL